MSDDHFVKDCQGAMAVPPMIKACVLTKMAISIIFRPNSLNHAWNNVERYAVEQANV